MPQKFEPGKSYPIETLPDDLYDKTIPNRDRWAIKRALFWNECQGWWQDSISDYWRYHSDRYGGTHMARFWQPEPNDPMTREEILAERGEIVCPRCSYAIKPDRPHTCSESTLALIAEQRALEAKADAATSNSPP